MARLPRPPGCRTFADVEHPGMLDRSIGQGEALAAPFQTRGGEEPLLRRHQLPPVVVQDRGHRSSSRKNQTDATEIAVHVSHDLPLRGVMSGA
jgi:hypothetical protein